MNKYSKQRELIVESLQKRYDHPTAEMVYGDVKEKLPSIGIATVYRNLAKLEEEGKVLKLKTKNGKFRYDGHLEEHIHFECENCSKIYDIFLNDSSEFNNEIEKIADTIGAKANNCKLIISGYCKNCKN